MKNYKLKKIVAVFLSMLTVYSIISAPASALSDSTLKTINAYEESESIETPKSISITKNLIQMLSIKLNSHLTVKKI